MKPCVLVASLVSPASAVGSTIHGRPAALRGIVNLYVSSRRRFVSMTAVALALALPEVSLAGPTGGTVVGGSASISQAGTTTNINQSSANAIINWQGFSVGKNETVNFNQPSSQAATL